MRLKSITLVLVIFIFASPPAFAYVLGECLGVPCDWSYMPYPMGEVYLINPNCTDPEVGSTDQQIAAIRAGERAWENEGNANFNFIYSGPTTIDDYGLDGYNVVVFAQYNLGSNVLAVAYLWYHAYAPEDIIEVDITFNDYRYRWHAIGNPPLGQRDIWNTAAHEFGHWLSLGHSSVTGATMKRYSGLGDIVQRDLHQDDIDGIQAIYGAAPNTNPVLSNGYVIPSEGSDRTVFSYYVDYYDADGDVPSGPFPSGPYVYIDGIPHTMYLDSGTPSNGTYRYNHTGLGLDTHYYYFYFNDGNGGSDFLPVLIPWDAYRGPEVHSTFPELSEGYVTPIEGYNTTTFYYYVDYYNEDGGAPTISQVYIDDIPYSMNLDSGAPHNGTYLYDIRLQELGTHNYYFYFEDSDEQGVRLPVSGTYQEPTVNQAPPGQLAYVREDHQGVCNENPVRQSEIFYPTLEMEEIKVTIEIDQGYDCPDQRWVELHGHLTIWPYSDITCRYESPSDTGEYIFPVNDYWANGDICDEQTMVNDAYYWFEIRGNGYVPVGLGPPGGAQPPYVSAEASYETGIRPVFDQRVRFEQNNDR